ncbi:hypothetical protein [Methylotenera sp. N17]|uniref:hypothetical protein n=1 Tax=Methylotenera sp. N17 TaxID=1502761 RepID=UPI000646F848|nr:hypothetical protein [Methylotenera sp. N17]
MAILEDFKQKKTLIKLRKLFIEMQNECEDYAKNNALEKRIIKSLSNRGNTKRLYFLERGDWSETFQKKINALQLKTARLGYTGRKKPRDFWTPTIIEHATKVQFVIYQAKAVRKLSISQARAFAIKHEYEKLDHSQTYFAKYYNGRDCNIRVEYENLIKYYQFTDIAICLCENNKIPKIKKRIDHTLDLFPSQPEIFSY